MTQLLKTIRLTWTFYKNFILLSLIITAICTRIFSIYGLASFFGIFWCKVLTLVLTYSFINAAKTKEYYYYRNLGISKTKLWSVTLGFDFIFFLFLLILTHYLK